MADMDADNQDNLVNLPAHHKRPTVIARLAHVLAIAAGVAGTHHCTRCYSASLARGLVSPTQGFAELLAVMNLCEGFSVTFPLLPK